MVEYAVTNKIEAAKLGECRFEGKIAEKLENVIRERMNTEHARRDIFGEAEAAFELCADDANAPVGLWHGEFWGKLMIGMCRGYRYTGDAEMLDFIRKSTYRVLSHQREDGYLGSYKNERQIFSADPEATKNRTGIGCGGNWTWNIWCRKYTLWGLLEAFEVTGDRNILDSAARSVDQMIAMLRDMDTRICETGTFYGLPSGSILKPLLILYRHTGEARYLELAQEIAREWQDSDDSANTKIISRSMQGLPLTHWTDLLSETPAKSAPIRGRMENRTAPQGKVYEMLSCFDGLLELYRVTGTELYLEATKRFFDLLIRYEYNTLFSVGFNDIFLDAASVQNAVTEICDVIHFMRVASELFKLTADGRYMEYVERAFYNAFLAGVSRDGTDGSRGVRPIGSNIIASEQRQINMKYNHCCLNNISRGFFNVAECFAMSGADAVYINLYSPVSVTLHPQNGGTVRVQIGGGYLESGAVTIRIDGEFTGERRLKLRIPDWSRETRIRIGGVEYKASAGTYFETSLASGTTEITMQFTHEPRLISSSWNVPHHPNTPYMKNRYYFAGEVRDKMLEEPHALVMVGPLLLAASAEFGTNPDDLFPETVEGRGFSVTAEDSPIPGTLYACRVRFDNGQEAFTRTLCDFASAADGHNSGRVSYNLFQ